MRAMMEYKGYHAKIEYDAEDEIFVGEVFGITDSLNFHGNSIDELKNTFYQCIDNYLDICAKTGKNPDKEFKGTFNVRIPPDLHKKLALKANAKNESLNSMVVRAIEQYVFTEESQQKEEGLSEAYNIFSLPIHENTVVIDTKTTANQRNFYQRPLFK